MEKKRNNNSSCPVDACEKFFKAITASSPLWPIRRISNHHHHHHHHPDRDSKPSNPASNPSVAASADSIPIEKTHLQAQKHPKFDFPAAPQKNGKVASVAPNKDMEEPLSQSVQARKIATTDDNAAAAAAQEKRHKAAAAATTTTRMESSSNNKMNNASGGGVEEDKFTQYINRARDKIRKTPSSVGGDHGKNGKIITATATGGGEDTGGGKDHHFSDYINRAKKKMLRTMTGFVVGGKGD